MIHPSLEVDIIDNQEEVARVGAYRGKPFIRISNPDGTLDLTFNQLGMLFGVAKGSAKRFVEEGKLPADNVPPEWLV